MGERISTLSTEFVRVPVTQTIDGVTVDPTGGTVEIGFPAAGVAPEDADFETAEWEAGGPPYFARILVGPDGDISLDAGDYDTWVRFDVPPEQPVLPAGSLSVRDTPLTVVRPEDVEASLRANFDASDFEYVAGVIADLEAEASLIMGRDLSIQSWVDVQWNETHGGNLFLPHRPVVAVSSAAYDYGTGGGTTLDAAAYLVWPWGLAGIPAGRVTVAYTAGIDAASSPRAFLAVRTQVKKAAARLYRNQQAGVAGFASVSVEGESVTALGSGSSSAAGGDDPAGFSAAERAVLAKFKRRVAYSGVTGYAGGYLLGSDI